jgi:hypothetical protein
MTLALSAFNSLGPLKGLIDITHQSSWITSLRNRAQTDVRAYIHHYVRIPLQLRDIRLNCMGLRPEGKKRGRSGQPVKFASPLHVLS